MEWVTKYTDDRIVKELQSSLPSTERIAKLLALRGISDESEAQYFLEPKLAYNVIYTFFLTFNDWFSICFYYEQSSKIRQC